MADISLGWKVDSWSGDPYSPGADPAWAKVRNDSWPGYTFEVRFRPDLAVAGFDIDTGDGAALTAEVLRTVPLGEIAAVARAHMAAWWSQYEATRPEVARQLRPLPAALAGGIDMRRRGRRGRPDAELAAVAAAYVRCQGDRRPTVALAAETGLDPSQLRGLLAQARRRGLLTATAPGLAGGSLTAKGRRLASASYSTAWAQAGPEQRQSALDRDRRFGVLNAAAEVGQVTTDEYRERMALLVQFTY